MALTLLNSGCYNSLGYKTNSTDVIANELNIYHYHPKDNRNLKVSLTDGSSKKYCCISRKQDDVVFFNKLKTDDTNGNYYEPHGYPIDKIKNIKSWNGETFGSGVGSFFGGFMSGLFEGLLEVGVDAAFDAAFDDSDDDTETRSNSKSHRGKRDSRSGSSDQNKERKRSRQD